MRQRVYVVGMDATTLGAAAGGVGLFLLGVRLLTEGLKVAAGRWLGRMLRRATASRPRALFTGLGLTALVQSSSAVTVATLGFVNAGILGTSEALWVVFGSNVGTSMTGWLVSITGVDLEIGAYALPMIGAGALARALDRRRRIGALGEALAGLGLLFLGLALLGDAFGQMREAVELPGDSGPLAAAVLLGIGALLTVLMQSSSAAIAVTLSAAAAGAIDLTGAGAMVIGANLGTTSTALLAVIDATPAARRAAAGHVVFNLLAAVVAIAMLPWLLGAVELVLGQTLAAGEPTGATLPALAAFHTIFNVLGVLLVWPIAGRLERVLAKRWVSLEEKRSRPRHLDRNVLAVPEVGIEAIARETGRLGRHAGDVLAEALAPSVDDDKVARLALAYGGLGEAISGYAAELSRHPFSEPTTSAFARLLRARRHYDTVVEQARAIVELRAEGELDVEGPYLESLRSLVEIANPESPTFAISDCERALGRLQERYERARSELFEANGDVGKLVQTQHWMAEARRGARQLVRGAEDLVAAANAIS